MHLIGCSAGPGPVAQIEIVLWRASVNQTVKQRCHGAAGDQLQSCRARPLQGTLQCRAGNEPSQSFNSARTPSSVSDANIYSGGF